MTTRRGFLKGLFAGAGAVVIAAPAICQAKNLMKLWVPKQDFIMPGDIDYDGIARAVGIHPDMLYGDPSARAYSKAYSQLLVHQDVLGETFFPTIIL